MNCVLEMMDFAFKMMNFALKMMDLAFKVMDFVVKNDALCIKNDDLISNAKAVNLLQDAAGSNTCAGWLDAKSQPRQPWKRFW